MLVESLQYCIEGRRQLPRPGSTPDDRHPRMMRPFSHLSAHLVVLANSEHHHAFDPKSVERPTSTSCPCPPLPAIPMASCNSYHVQ